MTLTVIDWVMLNRQFDLTALLRRYNEITHPYTHAHAGTHTPGKAGIQKSLFPAE